MFGMVPRVTGIHQKLAKMRTVCAVGRYRGPADAFLETLSNRNDLSVGRWGREFRGRRWLNLATTPFRFAEEGGWASRLFMGTGFVITGGAAQLLTDVATKGIAVSRFDGHAGLDILPTPSDGRPCWTVTRFWAWPTGCGFGRTLIQEVLIAADSTGTVLLLQAGNRRLAAEFYGPLGFVVQAGEEKAKRPWIERQQPLPSTLPATAQFAGAADIPSFDGRWPLVGVGSPRP
jgi:hypothetical protein